MQKKNMSQILLAAILISGMNFLVPGTASAAEWGSITGRFVLDGPVPEPVVQRKKGDPTVKDSAVCAATDHLSKDLVVNPDNKGIQNIFLYVYKPKEIHPELKESKNKTVVFDQKGCTFKPHALIVRTDQKVIVKSDDPVAHNTHTNPLRNEAVNFILAPNDREGKEVSNPIPEILPMQVKCDIHPWMTAYWYVVDHPYAVVSDADGKFTIKNLPAGKQTFRIWHEKKGYLDRRYNVTVKPGETVDLGEIKYKAADF
ncbi:hypothetical protein Pan153_05350 [Gimesia panareensis]|uniref:Rhamnogalacturonan lyase domain-containing protein n=1 Tax=Gimesia panareensis TaxID=2527978 RepID=A0A518FHU0_9PLAN|nr:carboxypeptidase regulatory-like domain-containing protein [Gimesia panareensis]QDV15916.1 hypothetical protein Pan153_05350 [Gimesia panareensis]